MSDNYGIVSLLVGGLAGFLINTEMVKESDWLKRHWYALPIALLLVGYMLWKRRNPHGKTMMALGGFLFMQGFMNRPKKEEGENKETGAPGWDYSWQPPPGQWVVTPDGQRVLMPAPQWQRYQDTSGPALQQRTGSGVDPMMQVVEEIYGQG
ncbi:MAG TPA: hypothetical protein VFF45_00710 [Bacilli bacterium]|nr:hypothetical protein [Bacilli bacterium]